MASQVVVETDPALCKPPNFDTKEYVAIKVCTITWNSFTFTPVSAFFIKDDPSVLNVLVIIYNLKYVNSRQQTVETYVPYYMSDGQTNELRADLLFPFLCINDSASGMYNCPVSATRPHGTLYKHQVQINLNFSLQPDDRGKYQVPPEILGDKDGLSTVLDRARNLLDFIIAIQSDLIREELIEHEPLMFRPFRYDMNKMKFNYNYRFLSVKPKSEPNLRVKDDFRQTILRCLLFYKKAAIEKSNVLYKPCYLNVFLSSVQEFNSIIRVCSTSRGEFTNDTGEMYNKYKFISDAFVRRFKEEAQNDRIGNPFNNIILEPGSRTTNELADVVRNWQATCKRPEAATSTVDILQETAAAATAATESSSSDDSASKKRRLEGGKTPHLRSRSQKRNSSVRSRSRSKTIFVQLSASSVENKEYMVQIGKRRVHFGFSHKSNYTKHKNPEKKAKYIQRFQDTQNWSKNGLYTVGFWNRWLLFNKPTLREAIQDTERRFDIIITKKRTQ